MALIHLGTVASDTGDLVAAATAFDEAIQILAAQDDQAFLPLAQASAGAVADARADHQAADAHYREALSMAHEVGDRRIVAVALEGLAANAARGGQADQGARLLGAADRLRASIGVPVGPADERAYDEQVACIRAMLGEAHFAAAWSEGRRLPPDVAVASALEMHMG